jgi:phosphate/sulfate permease
MNCTNAACGSDNTRRLSMVYAEGAGTTKSSASTHGMVNVGNQLGSISTSTTSTNRYESDLARRCAPPEKPSFSWFFFSLPIVLIVGILFGAPHVADELGNRVATRYFDSHPTALKIYLVTLGVGLIVGIVLGAISAGRRFNAADAVYKQGMDAWGRSWLCMKCGNLYVV